MAFRYKTKFSSEILASAEASRFEQLGISEASLEALQPIIPPSVDLKRNIDLLGVAFNAAVVNRFNRNDDGIDTDSALTIVDYFINKPTNIEHRKQIVVGHIVSSAFSEFGSNKLLSRQNVEERRDPFNIALAAVVYKTVNPQFANLIEDEEEEYDTVVSASWELGFNDYCLALGSKNLNEAEIITDPKQIDELSQYLKAFDGSGKTDDGVSVNRLIIGEIFPLGIAFTTNPAADVEGLYVEEERDEPVEQEAEAEQVIYNYDEERCIGGSPPKKFNNKSSQSELINVNPENNYTLMDSEIIHKFEKMLTEKLPSKQFSEEAVANVTRIFHEAIRQKDEEYKAAKEAQEKAESEAQAEGIQLVSDVEALKEELVSAQSELTALQEEKEARVAQEAFNARMAGLDEEFELEQKDREIVATEIRELDSTNESFASFQEKLRVMWSHKTKAFIQESEEKIQDRINTEVTKHLEELKNSTAAEEVTPTVETEDVLDGAHEEPSELVTNNNAEGTREEPSLRDRFRDAFSKDNLTINI